MPTYPARVTASHEIMLGKPVIRGTRLTVELLLRKMSEGGSVGDLLSMYPHLETADVEAALAYATAVLAQEKVMDLTA